MNTTYEYHLSLDDMKKFKKQMLKIKEALNSQEFIYYLANKCYELLNKVTSEKLNTDELDMYIHTYRNNHQKKVIDNDIYLWNETMVDLSSLSEETLENYPNGLSLAKIVEYGTGIVGSSSEASKYAKDWQYDVNGHGEKGWFYVDSSGVLHWTKGIQGKLVFYETKRRIEENIENWISEYLMKTR